MAQHPLSGLPVQQLLDRIHAGLCSHTEGRVADYIPELARTDPSLFGIALVTLDGKVYQSGDSQHKFTIQSISKPLTFGLALSDHGVAEVNRYVSVEPTGDAFNSISLEPDSGRPLNPMINAGAIATSGLIKGDSDAKRFQRILDCYGQYAGRGLLLNEAVYASEKSTGHRNRAISHLLRNFDILSDDPEPPLDLYFRQCSVDLTCRDLAVMAATLANYGVNPITGIEVLKLEHVEKVLSVMSTCGMYDYSGRWLYDVGLPAKSGVGGGILAVLPGQFGLGVFSPPLDKQGNSARGIKVCEILSREFRLHMFHGQRGGSTAIRAHYDGTVVSSRRDRLPEIAELIEQHGHGIRVYELHGDLVFDTAEYVTREVSKALEQSQTIVLDLRRVMSIDSAAAQLLTDLHQMVADQGGRLLFTQLSRYFRFQQLLLRRLGPRAAAELQDFPDLDHALEWCEDQLLARLEQDRPVQLPPGLADQELLSGFTGEEFAAIESKLATVKFFRGDTIISEGGVSECLYFLTEGEVSVVLSLGSKQKRRLARLSAGMSFGEMAMLDHQTRSADILAESDVTCRTLVYEALDDLPDGLGDTIRIKLLQNLGRQLSRKMRRANQEIRALS